MLFSDALEVAIGLTFVFLLVSLAMTAIVESLEGVLKTRGAQLHAGIMELLGDPARADTGVEAARAVYTHPLVQGLFRGGYDAAAGAKRLPSYVPARNFALALIDQALAAQVNADRTASRASLPGPSCAPFGDRLRLAAEGIDNEQLRRALVQAAEVGGDDAERARKHLENWYDSAMDRVSGRYKRRSHALLFGLGLALALLLNINTLTVADSLSKNATLRRAVVAQIEQRDLAADTQARPDARRAVQDIDRLGLPLGWTSAAIDALGQPLRAGGGTAQGFAFVLGAVQIVLGYLLTALATTLGAPFWFDTLNRLMVIRATVKPREKSPEEGSQDRTARDDRVVVVAAEAKREAPAPVLPVAEREIDREVYARPPDPGETPFEEWQP